MLGRAGRLNPDSSLRIKTPPGLSEPQQDLELTPRKRCTCFPVLDARGAFDKGAKGAGDFYILPCDLHPTCSSYLAYIIAAVPDRVVFGCDVMMIHGAAELFDYADIRFTRNFLNNVLDLADVVGLEANVVYTPPRFDVPVSWPSIFEPDLLINTFVSELSLTPIIHAHGDYVIRESKHSRMVLFIQPSIAFTESAFNWIKFLDAFESLCFMIDGEEGEVDFKDDLRLYLLDMRQRTERGRFWADSYEPIYFASKLVSGENIKGALLCRLFGLFLTTPFTMRGTSHFLADCISNSSDGVYYEMWELMSDIATIVSGKPIRFTTIHDREYKRVNGFYPWDLDVIFDPKPEFVENQCDSRDRLRSEDAHKPYWLAFIFGLVLIVTVLAFALGMTVNEIMHMINGNIYSWNNVRQADSNAAKKWYTLQIMEQFKTTDSALDPIAVFLIVSDIVIDAATVFRAYRYNDFYLTFGLVRMFLTKYDRSLVFGDIDGYINYAMDTTKAKVCAAFPDAASADVGSMFSNRAHYRYRDLLHGTAGQEPATPAMPEVQDPPNNNPFDNDDFVREFTPKVKVIENQAKVDTLFDLVSRFSSFVYKLLFDTMGVTLPETVKSWVDSLGTTWVKGMDVAGIVSDIWKVLHSIYEMVLEFATTGDYTVFFGKDTDKVLAEAAFLLDSEKYIRIKPNAEPELTYDDRITRCKDCVKKLRTLKFKDTPATILYRLIAELNDLVVLDERILAGGDNHIRPLTLYIFGEKSVGKTTLCYELDKISLSVVGRNTSASNTVFVKYMNEDAEFAEGVNFCPAGTQTVILDEMLSQKPGPNVPFPLQPLFTFGQTTGAKVQRAFDKSNDVIYNYNLFCLSNTEVMTNLDYWVNNVSAAINRIDFSIKIEFKPEHKPDETSYRGAGHSDPENNRIFTIGKHILQDDVWVFRPFSLDGEPTHRFTSTSEFKNWYDKAFTHHYVNGRAAAERAHLHKDKVDCVCGKRWLLHGKKCNATCDWETTAVSRIRTGWFVKMDKLGGSTMVEFPPGQIPPYGYIDLDSRPFVKAEPPKATETENQSLVEVTLGMALMALLVAFVAYFPSREYWRALFEDIAYLILRRFLKEEATSAKTQLANHIRANILRVSQRKDVLQKIFALVVASGGLVVAARSVATPTKAQETEDQMDAKFREATWPSDEGRKEDYAHPLNPLRQEWGQKRAVFAPERLSREKMSCIQSNMVLVRTSLGSAWGNYIRPNVILVNSHLIPDEDALSVEIGTRKLILARHHFVRHPTKDMALIASPDIHPNTSMLFERCVVRETRKIQSNGYLIFKDRVEEVKWRPTTVPLVTKTHTPGWDVTVQEQYQSKNGDCGAVAVTDAGEIIGIHNFAGGGVWNMCVADLAIMLSALPVDPLTSGGLVYTKVTSQILASCEEPSELCPFKTDPLTIPIGKLPEFVMMHSKFKTAKALGWDEFHEDLILEAGEDFARPTCNRAFDPKLGYKARGEERALIEMRNPAQISVIHAEAAMNYLLDQLKEEKWNFLCPFNPPELAKHLKGNTSAGYPWQTTKNNLLDDERYFDPEYEKEIIEILHKSEFDVVVGFSSMSLKDEPRKASKVAVGDVRVFEVLGAINSAGACLVVPLILEMAKHPKFGFMVGLNCVSKSWGEMYNDLARRGLHTAFFLDGKKYDKHMSFVLSRQVARFVTQVAICCGYTEKNVKRVYNIVLSAVVRFLRVFGEIAFVKEANPSGSFMTTLYNMIVMLMILVSTFQQHYPDRDFFTEVSPKLFGDDSLGTVNEGNPLFNQVAIRDHAAEFFGQEFTSGRKDGNLVPYEDLQSGVFLKRGFNFRDGRVLCPLERASIFKMLCWRTPSNNSPITIEEHFAEVANNALKEAYLHSREFYDYLLAKILLVKTKHGLVFDVPTFESIDNLYNKDELIVWDA